MFHRQHRMQNPLEKAKDLEEVLGSILRGAAKILGCISANLISFDRKTQEARVWVGTIAERFPQVKEVESFFGSALQNTVFLLKNIEDSLIVASWRNKTIYETSSLAELVGSAFAEKSVAQVSAAIGDQRFICVPVICESRAFGVIIFTKEDLHPFGVQRREILFRYAQRIGEIIENELKSSGSVLSIEGSDLSTDASVMHFFLDRSGKVSGYSLASAGCPESERNCLGNLNRMPALPGRSVEELADQVRQALASWTPQEGEAHLEIPVDGTNIEGWNRSRLKAVLSRVLVGGEEHVLCAVHQLRPKPESSIQTQLLHFALGRTVPAVLVDAQFRITSCNQAAEQLFGYSNDELLCQPIDIIFQDSRYIHGILNHQFLYLSNGYFEDITVVRHKDGRIFMGKVKALLLADENNQVIGFLVLIHDQASDGVAYRENAVNRLMRRERLATMGEMAAQLAHEIRNPLVSIGATLEMLARENQKNDSTREIMANLAKEVTRMDTVLQEYLSLATRRNAMVNRVDLAGILADAQRLINDKQEIQGVKIHSKLEKGLYVLADSNGLRHVFHNLLLNALEASPDGGVITCHPSVSTKAVTIHIDDQGCGISGGVDECFEPFFTTKVDGTGLGLTVCQKIVEAHGGTISLKNLEQGGCRASITLPLKGMQ